MKKTLCVNLRSAVAKEDMEGPLGQRLKPFPRSTGSFLSSAKKVKDFWPSELLLNGTSHGSNRG